MTVLCATKLVAMLSKLPNCVPFQADEFGMPSDCVARCDAIYALETAEIRIAAGAMSTRCHAIARRHQSHRRCHRLGLRPTLRLRRLDAFVRLIMRPLPLCRFSMSRKRVWSSLQGPDFESGTSAIAVALETCWNDE